MFLDLVISTEGHGIEAYEVPRYEDTRALCIPGTSLYNVFILWVFNLLILVAV